LFEYCGPITSSATLGLFNKYDYLYRNLRIELFLGR
jgi:hypothetical protein